MGDGKAPDFLIPPPHPLSDTELKPPRARFLGSKKERLALYLLHTQGLEAEGLLLTELVALATLGRM